MNEKAADSWMPVSSNMANMYAREIKKIGMVHELTLSVVYISYMSFEGWRAIDI